MYITCETIVFILVIFTILATLSAIHLQVSFAVSSNLQGISNQILYSIHFSNQLTPHVSYFTLVMSVVNE